VFYRGYFLLNWHPYGFKLEKSQVRLSQIGWVNIRKHRELPQQKQIRTCSILVKNGKYYACFSCEIEPQPLPKTGKKLGIDMGLTSFLATSDKELKGVSQVR
jgi:putative transposase